MVALSDLSQISIFLSLLTQVVRKVGLEVTRKDVEMCKRH